MTEAAQLVVLALLCTLAMFLYLQRPRATTPAIDRTGVQVKVSAYRQHAKPESPGRGRTQPQPGLILARISVPTPGEVNHVSSASHPSGLPCPLWC